MPLFFIIFFVNLIGLVWSTALLLFKLDDWDRFSWIQVALPYGITFVVCSVLSALLFAVLAFVGDRRI